MTEPTSISSFTRPSILSVRKESNDLISEVFGKNVKASKQIPTSHTNSKGVITFDSIISKVIKKLEFCGICQDYAIFADLVEMKCVVIDIKKMTQDLTLNQVLTQIIKDKNVVCMACFGSLLVMGSIKGQVFSIYMDRLSHDLNLNSDLINILAPFSNDCSKVQCVTTDGINIAYSYSCKSLIDDDPMIKVKIISEADKNQHQDLIFHCDRIISIAVNDEFLALLLKRDTDLDLEIYKYKETERSPIYKKSFHNRNIIHIEYNGLKALLIHEAFPATFHVAPLSQPEITPLSHEKKILLVKAPSLRSNSIWDANEIVTFDGSQLIRQKSFSFKGKL